MLPCSCVCVCPCACACSFLQLVKTQDQMNPTHSCGQSIWHVLRKQLHSFCQAFLLSYRIRKKLLQKLNKHWSTTCSQYLHARCVKHVRNTTELSKASSHANKSDKSREIGSLACLVTIQQLLHDPKPLGAQTRGKYTEKEQEEKTLGHM